MFLENNRSRIETRYESLLKELPSLMGQIDEKIKGCSPDVQLALKYLYGTTPVSDIGSYEFDVFLDYAEHGIYLYEKCDYVKKMPEEIFLNYVLYHRVNEEEVAPCRTLFYQEIKDRIQGMTMKEAALEINYWCLEKATYQSTDGRTAAAVTVYRCGYGRCGEESVFTISAMRSAGIPARQVYAPRWSHCDDNHAWVEVWCDGEWYFTGACEPEPILNKGWFTNASSRAMLIHSRWFDLVLPSGENIIGKEGTATVLNQLKRYAATRELTIRVKNEDGTPVSGARISLEILNYGEFSPVASLKTGEDGTASITIGLGSIHIVAVWDELWGELLFDTRADGLAEVTLSERKVSEKWEDFDIIAPVDTPVNTDQPTEKQKEERDIRMAKASAIRIEKTENYVPEWKTEFVEKETENRELCEKLMETLSEKDRVDASAAVLRAHFDRALPLKDNYPEEIFISYVLNPRVAREVLTDWRGALTEFLEGSPLKEEFRAEPEKIWAWIEENIKECPGKERTSIYTPPAAALKLKIAGRSSKEVLFVAIARTLGIPARLNPMDHSMEYLKPAEGLEGKEAYEKGTFVSVLKEKEKSSHLELLSGEKVTYTYFQNWSIARLGEKGYQSLWLFHNTWEDGKLRLDLEPGTYRLITANRLPNGNIFGKQYSFSLEKGEKKQIAMEFRDAKLTDMLENISILPFHLLDKDGNRVPAGELMKGAKKVFFWLEESKEPTEHILNELMERKEEFEKYQENLRFIIRSDAALSDPTLAKCMKALPKIQVSYDTFKENVNTLGRRMYVDPDKLPLIIVTDGELNGIYATSGYNVGTADMLLRLLELS